MYGSSMGQALYDAQVEFFRANQFYDSSSLSPFLIVQPDSEKGIIELGAVRIENSKYVMTTETTSKADLTYASTIEEVEDAFLSSAERRGTVARDLTFFAVNAQSSFHGTIQRRGTGWIVLMHPETFEHVKASVTPEFEVWEKLFSEEEQMRLGRWRLAATKVDRCQHYWLSEDIPPFEVITVYRCSQAAHKIDGIIALQTADGFLYRKGYKENYVLRWVFNPPK